jgi:hypothetical protein
MRLPNATGPERIDSPPQWLLATIKTVLTSLRKRSFRSSAGFIDLMHLEAAWMLGCGALDETRIFTLSAPGVYRIVVSVDNPGPGARPLAEWTIRIS